MLNEASKETFDIIVVPGVPFQEDSTWSRLMKARVYWSKYLYDKGIAKNIMYSGSAVYTPYYEGEIMALYGAAIGIPKEHIYAETKAEHSVENIYYGYKKAKLLGFEKIALASDPFQSKQLARFVKVRLGKDVGVIPMVFDTLRAMEPKMIDPDIDFNKAYKKDFVSLVSRESFWQRFKGTRGGYIDSTAYTSDK